MNRIAQHAANLGLPVTANAFAETTIDPAHAPSDARLTDAVASDIKRIFGQMARRGSDPKLFAALWAKLADRPLERALVAVDVLAQALWAPNDPLLHELRSAAQLLGTARPALGELGVDLTKHPAHELIARHGAPLQARATVELLVLAYEQNLGALDELRQRNDLVLARLSTRQSIHAFARLAALARLPTLASVYLDWLVRSLGWPVPALDLCETLFDAGAAHKIPGAIVEPRAAGVEHAEYLLYRSHLSVGDADTAHALMMQNLNQRVRWVPGSSLRVDVVRAHLGLLYGHNDISVARVELACDQDPLWRYSAQVRAMIAAKDEPARALACYCATLNSFGNDFESSLIVLSLVPESVKRDVARIICREAFYLPHEPAPWKLLGVLDGCGDRVAAEITERLHDQSR